ncbi:MAG: hypothetical protein IJM57_02590 [Lachnospiraceae bacterium]|nr:hypothetical protein [Lachnospiraceae bacterium]
MAKYCMCCNYEFAEDYLPKFCPSCGSKLEGRISDEPTVTDGSSNTAPVETMTNVTNNIVAEGNLSIFGMMGNPQPEEWNFEYSTSGMMFRSGVTYRAWKKDGKAYAQVRLSGIDMKDAPIFEVEEEFLTQLETSLNLANADAWNGFHGHAQGVYDGDSFSFHFFDGNNRRINAGGYMAWPDNFGVASGMWYTMFYGLYDSHFPNYPKRLHDHITNELIKQYGYSSPSNCYVPFLSLGGSGFQHGSTAMKPGVLTYMTADFSNEAPEGANTQSAYAESLVVRVTETPREKLAGNDTGIVLELYRSDSEGIRKMAESVALDNLVEGEYGETGILVNTVGGRRTVVVYRNSRFYFYPIYKRSYVAGYHIEDGEWKSLGSSVMTTPSGEASAPETEIEEFCGVLEKLGMDRPIADIREKRKDIGYFGPNSKDVVRFHWNSNLDSDFSMQCSATEAGKAVKGYQITVNVNPVFIIR